MNAVKQSGGVSHSVTMQRSPYNAALRERGSPTVWFDPGMVWHAEPSGKRGGQAVYSDAAIQTCLTIKVLFACR